MKKVRIFSLIMFLFLINSSRIFGEEGLEMNSDDLKVNNKSQVYTSITDIYGIPLFTDKTIEQKEKLKAKDKEIIKKAEDNIFNGTINKNDSCQEFNKKVQEYKLFSAPHTETKIKYTKSDAGIRFISIMIIIAVSVLTGIFTTKYYKYKRKKDAGNVEYNNYTGF